MKLIAIACSKEVKAVKERQTKWRFSDLLTKKIEEHDAIVKCPYCKKLFDIHAGLIFLEGKEVPLAPPGYAIEHFEEIMSDTKKTSA